jgi:hypothetical protein
MTKTLAIIQVFKQVKVMMKTFEMNGKMESLSKEIKDIKQSQMDILEPQSNSLD